MAGPEPQSIREILPKPRKSLLGTLDVYPKGVEFATQDRGESVYILVRRHVITNLGWMLRVLAFLITPIIVIAAIEWAIASFPEFLPRGFNLWDFVSVGSWVLLALIYYSTVISYAFAKLLDWYFDIYLITSQRFIHIEFRILTGKFVSEASLKNIEDIRQNVVGILPALFDYGDIIVTTASDRGKFLFESVPDPTWFRNVLTDLSKFMNRRGGGRREEP
ncbi:MAG: hypothetical protein QY330_02595 [Candidatus Dojkabacteria bacterium]|uniref:DUF304 domain-containing protein n=1 Tax=Candidatus Dojkabacteria bacterium TaxID=2099670 RepID=A0A952DS88_9BACT|nr:hypothetical protein [Candidatus Dojkabacteria bacterium]WKZ28462.1 MAG: hypothetical protein QY330_02595 [Candidatus Dojkabacteria bacterium]